MSGGLPPLFIVNNLQDSRIWLHKLNSTNKDTEGWSKNKIGPVKILKLPRYILATNAIISVVLKQWWSN